MLRILLFCSALAISGCSAIGALDEASRPLAAYDLQAESAGPVARGNAAASELVVESPVAGGALDTDRILIRPDPLEARYLPGARWTDPAPAMVRTLMVRRLEETGGFRYVGRRPLGSAGDYALLSELTDLQAEVFDETGIVTARIRLNAKLVREEDARVLASRVFEATTQTGSTDTMEVVSALDRAMTVVLNDMSRWIMQRLGVPIAAEPA